MKFDRYENVPEVAQMVKENWVLLSKALETIDKDHQSLRIQYAIEAVWVMEKRPYYKVYPGIMEHLMKVKLDIKLGDLNLKRRAWALFLPEGHGSALVLTDPKCFGMTVQTPEMDCASILLPPSKERKISEMLQWDDRFSPVLQLAIAVVMLEEDKSIIEPEVLSKDRDAYIAADTARQAFLVDRAKRRGVLGWSVGRHVEVMPHFRRPHFAIRWTCKGRTTPVLTAIKGSIIHREIVERIPTDTLDK
jgi:hypothetical protein